MTRVYQHLYNVGDIILGLRIVERSTTAHGLSRLLIERPCGHLRYCPPAVSALARVAREVCCACGRGKTNTERYEHDGELLTVTEIARCFGRSKTTVRKHLQEGIPCDNLLSPPHLITANGETLSEAEWARRLGCNRSVIAMRLRSGWDEETAVTTPVGAMWNGKRPTHRPA